MKNASTAKIIIDEVRQNVIAGAELYEVAFDLTCECANANHGGYCPRCGAIEKARKHIEFAVGPYRQQ